MMKWVLLGLLSVSNVMAGSVSAESTVNIGNVAVFISPYFEENGKQFPINIDYHLEKENPALKTLCARLTGASVSQIDQAGATIETDDGMLYDAKTDSFSPVPQPNTEYNSLSTITCQSKSFASVPLGGTTSYLSNGSMKVEHPTVAYGGISYPISPYVEYQVETLCQVLGYSGVEAAQFSYLRRDPATQTLVLNVLSERYRMLVIPELQQSGRYPTMLLESITCKK